MHTDRIPSLLAQALLSLDGSFPIDGEGENENPGNEVELGSEGPQRSGFSLVSQINGNSSPVGTWGNSVWKHFKSPVVKNSDEAKANPKLADPNLQNDAGPQNSIEGFERGFRFFLFNPEPQHHFDI